MHGTSDTTPVPLSGIGGLVALANPVNIPEGASPRTYDTDFLVGSAHTRPGTTNRVSFANSFVSHLPTQAASVSAGSSQPWTNPAGVEGSASFASVSFGSGPTTTATPQSVTTQGAGIAWQTPGAATGTGTGTAQPITITSVGISGNVVTFGTAPQSEPLVAGQTVTLSQMAKNTFLDGQVLTVLATGLSTTGFEANFTHANVATGIDAGVATPSTSFTSAQTYAGAVTPPAGQYVAYAQPTAAQSSVFTSGYYGSGSFSPYYYDAYGFGAVMGGSGVNGGPFAPTLTASNSVTSTPALPAGAVIQAIYAIAKGTRTDPGNQANYYVKVSNGSNTVTLLDYLQFNNTWASTSLGTNLAAALAYTFTFSIQSTGENVLPGSNPFGVNCVTGFAIVYSLSSGSPLPPSASQLQTLTATNLGLAVSGNIQGVEVNLDAGLRGAGTGILTAQLTLAGVPVGTPKTLAAGAWSTPQTLGGASDLWGLSSLTAAQVNGSNGLGVNISGVLNAPEIDLNGLQLAVTETGPTVSDYLDATAYSFALTTPVTGIAASATAYGTGSLTAQLLINGAPTGNIKTVPLPGTAGTVNFGGALDIWGIAGGISDANVNATTFGLRVQLAPGGTAASVQDLAIAAWTVPNATNFQWTDTFTAQDGTVSNLYLDALGNLYVENVTSAPGVLTSVLSGIATDAVVIDAKAPGVEYLAFSNGFKGIDMPLQYTPNWVDRITQVGPGAAPTFTPLQASNTNFTITSITQNPANSDITDPGHISVLLQSAGPGSTAPGNVITVYYSPSYYSGAPQPGAQDTVLVNAFNSGQAVYIYLSGTPFGSGTYLVTSVGNALPPGIDHYRYYFTVQTTTSTYQQATEAAGQYQMTVATLTTSAPVPGLGVGNTITVSGATPAAWNAQWPISQALNSSNMTITGTSVTGSVATYDYALTGGSTAAPAAGQLVTITGTLNANGALNLANATIVSASGGSTGSFTINVSVTSATFQSESGQAETAGTQFAFDPGLGTLGTTNDPIFGNTTVGGQLTFTSSTAQLIGAGTRKGTVFFITRNGYYTAPAPPVTFDCPANTTAISATNIPLGPPNVIARGIAFTEAGQNGVPGANFFTIPTPVTYTVANVSYTASALILKDNVTTAATFNFTDAVLLSALAVDVYGYNLFNQIEIGDPGWIKSYSSRNFYGLCLNKVQNFINMSFDGGYLPANQTVPLGWSQPDQNGSLIASPKFGNSYYIKAYTVGVGVETWGLIYQTAYQDAYQQPIIQPNTTYSVRVTCSNPSGINGGNLVIGLVSAGVFLGKFELALSAMTTTLAKYTGTLLTAAVPVVPANLQLWVYATNMVLNADVLIDRIDIYPTEIPVLTTTVYGSYAGLPEQVDGVTGQAQFDSENQQPVTGAMVMYDTFYALKGWGGTAPGSSMYSFQASANLEPAQWEEPEVAQRLGGAIGPLAFDMGEQWFVGATRTGLYLFVGGQPGKIMQEIFQVWEAINWAYGSRIWVFNDEVRRRLLVGVPMATPNFWLPNAPVNANPASPNVILMCNYQGLDSGEALKSGPQMHTTMFGTLNAIDMRRKWSIWQMPSPYVTLAQGAGDEEIRICSGTASGKVYALDETNPRDDGAIIDSLYTTAGLPEMAKAAQMPKMGNFLRRWGFMTSALQSLGTVNVRLLPNRVLYPEPASGYQTWTVPGGFAPGSPALADVHAPLNFAAIRAYVELRENDGYGFELSNVQLMGRADVWNRAGGTGKSG